MAIRNGFAFVGKASQNAKGTITVITSGEYLKDLGTLLMQAYQTGKPLAFFISRGQRGPGMSAKVLEPRPQNQPGGNLFGNAFGQPAPQPQPQPAPVAPTPAPQPGPFAPPPVTYAPPQPAPAPQPVVNPPQSSDPFATFNAENPGATNNNDDIPF